MHNPEISLERALEGFHALIRADLTLLDELAASRHDFFGAGGPAPGLDPLRDRRHLEWFLFERHSTHLAGSPSERLLGPWRESQRQALSAADVSDAEAAEEVEAVERALLSSFSGIFEVGEVRPGQGAWVRDVAGFGDYALAEPEGAASLQTGDLVVGRLHPLPGALHHASRAAGVFRNPDLSAALERDLGRAREGGPNILRLTAAELEPMFFGASPPQGGVPQGADAHAAPAAALETAVGDARTFLGEAGLPAGRIAGILTVLTHAPYDPERLAPGAGDVLGGILDELAFDTPIDLGEARKRLTLAWQALHLESSKPAAPDSGELPAGDQRVAAVEAFRRAREAGGDAQALLDQLERDLGIDSDDDPGADGPVPDFPGVVRALIDEYRWELSLSVGDEADVQTAPLDALASFGRDLGLVEELDARALLRFSAFWLLERGQLQEPAQATALLKALEPFCDWAEANHDLPLATEFGDSLQGLRESLPRIVAANRAVPAHDGSDPGELFEVRRLPRDREDTAELVQRDGTAQSVRMSPAIAAGLQPGDRLRGRVSPLGDVRVLRCYPPEAAGLLQA